MIPTYFHNQRLLLLLLLATTLFCLPSYAQVSGVVYRDFDGSGTRTLVDPNEIGANDVKVRAYVGSSDTPLLASTNEQGEFAFTATQIPAGSPVKLEFYDLGKSNYSGPYGAESGTSLQFVQAPNDQVRFGIFYPAEYCHSRSPAIVTSCFVNGDANAGGTTGELVALVSFPYDASGLTSDTNFPARSMGLVKEVGAVWGVLYHKISQKFVTSAILKRHASFGPLGTGGLYLTDFTTGVSTPFIDVKTLDIDTGDDPHSGLSANFLDPSLDTTALRKIGKNSIGALTSNESGERVFISNLNDRKIHSLYVGGDLQVPTKDSLRSYTIPNNCADPADFRPWALKGYRGDIYVGTVCSGETSGDTSRLKGIVYKFNPKEANPTFTQVLSFPLSFKRGSPDLSPGCERYYWSTWDDKFPAACDAVNLFASNPQPIISDIEFDVNGDMILGIMDRFGHQSGKDNYGESSTGGLFTGFSGGDLMRAGLNADGSYTLESNGIVGSVTGCGTGNGEGPGGGEFYCGDEWIFQGKVAHGEINNGALALVTGTNEVISTAMDPLSPADNSIFASSGWQAYRNSGADAGSVVREFVVYDQNYAGTFGKASGLGDIVAACDAAPVEIGNRVWLDRNRNGIQDASEAGIEGVILTLHNSDDSHTQIASDTTDAKGEYYFTNANVPGGLKFDHNYEVRLSMIQLAITTDSLQPAPPDQGNPVSDSDGILVIPVPGAPYVKISVTSGGIGQNDHTQDYGFGPASAIELITDSIRICSDEVTVLIAQVENVLPGDSVVFVLYDKVPTTIEEKLNAGTVLGKVAPDGTGLATLPNVIFPANTTADSASYIVCALFLTTDSTLLGVDNGSVVIDPIPVVVATLDGSLTCTQRIVNLSARSSVDSTVFSWTGPGGFTSSDSIVSVSVAGVYVLVGASLQGCISLSDTVIVVEEELPPGISTPEIAFCEPTSTTQLPALAQGQEWFVSFPNPAVVVIDTVSNTASGLTTNGVYYIKLREGFCISEDSLKITRNPALALRDSTTDFCATVTVNLSDYVSGYDTLTSQEWRLNTASGATVSNISEVVIDQNVTYVLIAANRFGCPDTASVTFVQKPEIILTATVDGTLGCESLPVRISTPVGPGITIQWNGPDGFTSNDEEIFVTKPGEYILTGTVVGGCPIVTDTAVVVEELTPIVVPAGPLVLCAPATTVELPPVSSALSYVAAAGNPAAITINLYSASGLTANGVYYVKTVSGKCVSTDSLMITRSPALVLRDSAATFCSTTSVDLPDYIDGYNALVNPVWHRGSASGATVHVINGVPITANVTYVLIANNAGGCPDTASVTFTVPVLPTGLLTLTPPTCDDGTVLPNGKITLSGIPGTMTFDLVQSATYNGTATFTTATAVPQDGVVISALANPSANTPYVLRIFNESGCFQDLFVTLRPVDCECPIICVPVSMKITRKK